MSPRRVTAFAVFAALTLCSGGGPSPVRGQKVEATGPELAPKLAPDLLASVTDDKPFVDPAQKTPQQVGERPFKELKAFNQAVLNAARMPLQAFEASAAQNKTLTYAQLLNDPEAHRGQVLTLEGSLRNLSREPAPVELQKSGVSAVYVGWIHFHEPWANPVWIAFPKLPDGIEEGEGVSQHVRVTGYFFKRIPYRVGKTEQKTVLLVGPTVTPLPFWLDARRTGVGAAAELIGVRQPLVSLAMVHTGTGYSLWPLPDQAPVLSARLLRAVRDEQLLPEDIGGRTPDRIGKSVYAEYEALCEALGYAGQTAPSDFAASAEKNKLTLDDLLKEPEKQRGQVVRLEGWVKSVRKLDAPLLVRQRTPVKVVYETWLALDKDGGRPVCVLAAELPNDLREAQQFGQRALVDGYFFKLTRFMTDKGPISVPLVVSPKVLLYAEPEVAPLLDKELLRNVRHDKAFADLRGKDVNKVGKPAFQELEAYNQAVVLASRTPLKAFEASGAENKDLDYGHLKRRPTLHAGKVVTVTGVLRRVTREETPRDLHARGVPVVYQGWIVLDDPETKPVCVIFTDLPKDIKTGDNLRYRVRFSGYFFKRYPFEVAKEETTTVLLIGPTVTLLSTPVEPAISLTDTLGGPMLMGILGLVAGTVVFIAILSVWFRRGDRVVKQRLRQYESSKFADEGARLQGLGEATTAEPPRTNNGHTASPPNVG